MATFELVNEKLLQIKMTGGEILTRRGAMVAQQGKVRWARSFLTGNGLQEVPMRAASGETLDLMRGNGAGDVFCAWRGRVITIIALTQDTLYVESDNVMAFDPALRSGIIFLGNQGGVRGALTGVASGQGLFTTTLEGQGQVALMSEGDCIGIPVTPNAPVFVDPQAYLAHTGQLTTGIKTDVSWKTFIGQTSGESWQLQFTGTGTVYIQASEE